ncbi:hypothetical protein ACLOJK_010410 [Asimina triloba]
MVAGTSTRPRTFKKEVAENEEEEESEEESGEESGEEPEKRKGIQGIIEIENPNVAKSKSLKARNVDEPNQPDLGGGSWSGSDSSVLKWLEKTTELSRREREEIEKQKAHERYMRLQEQGKTEQARKDLGKALTNDLKYAFTTQQQQSRVSIRSNSSNFSHIGKRLQLIRQQRAEAAKKREEEKAGELFMNILIPSIPFMVVSPHYVETNIHGVILSAKEQKKAEARK